MWPMQVQYRFSFSIYHHWTCVDYESYNDKKDVMLLISSLKYRTYPREIPANIFFWVYLKKNINGLNLIPPDQIPDWIERKKKVKMGRRIWAFSETNKRKARIEKDRQVGPKCSEFMKERSLQEKCRWSLGPWRQWNKIKKKKGR